MQSVTLSSKLDKPIPVTAGTSEMVIPIYIYAVVFSSFSIIIGVIWDISWHISIGRDGLFSAPHLAIYLGAVIAGIFSGYDILRLTIGVKSVERASSINFWGIFYGSLGALFCVWGAFTMLTSAPFDDWWHNTFGLDVKILSPPHAVLGFGIISVQFGALVSVLSLQNSLPKNASQAIRNILNACYILSSGFFMVILFTYSAEYADRNNMHNIFFYQIYAGIFPVLMVAISCASSRKWGATAMTLVYTATLGLMVWILPLFSAEPRLGPILNHITHYQSFNFPLLFIFPAIAIDWVNQHLSNKQPVKKVIVFGVLFVVVFFVVQWPFGTFLHTPYARNWFFGAESWYFGHDPLFKYRYAFDPDIVTTGIALIKGMGIAFVFAILSAGLGLAWGKWLKSLKR